MGERGFLENGRMRKHSSGEIKDFSQLRKTFVKWIGEYSQCKSDFVCVILSDVYAACDCTIADERTACLVCPFSLVQLKNEKISICSDGESSRFFVFYEVVTPVRMSGLIA